VSPIPVQLYLSQLAKTLVPSCYCLYSLFNKIRDKGKIVSARYRGGEGEREGAARAGGQRVEMTQALYAHMSNKTIKIKKNKDDFAQNLYDR
jgi:hypothetical protein